MSRLGVPAVGGAHRALNGRHDTFESAKPAPGGETFRLPICCMQTLGAASNRGTLMAAVGARMSAAGQVTIDWEQEVKLHPAFTTGVAQAPARGSLFDLVQAHQKVHAREPSTDAGKFWSKLFARKQAKMANARHVDMFERR